MRRSWLIALLLMLVTGIGNTQQSTQPEDAASSAPLVDVKTMIPPKVINHIDMDFPDDARRRHINGVCSMTLIVDAHGMPQDPKVIYCSDPSFKQNSLDAVMKWRFEPATRLDGTPMSVTISVKPYYQMTGGRDPKMPVRYAFRTPPDVASASPGADGVYPLTKDVTPPTMSKFSDGGYGVAAYMAAEKSSCDVVLTISAKGKPSDPEVAHCLTPRLEKSAIQSLLDSHYKPGSLNGKAIPVRASIHLEYGGVVPPE
jgi:hypothetical protein